MFFSKAGKKQVRIFIFKCLASSPGSALLMTLLMRQESYLQCFVVAGFRREKNFLIGEDAEDSLSDASSGYSTISNDNLPSPALYLPPPSGEDDQSELEQREGGVSGWDDWRISENEVSLGTVISSTERETTYRHVVHERVPEIKGLGE